MQVQVNAGDGIESTEALERWANDYLNEALARFRQDITGIEVQLKDENSGKSGPADKRCLLEARVTGQDPMVAEHRAENQDMAIRGATQKLLKVLDHRLGKLERRGNHDRETIRKTGSPLV
ncbi:HPF/RaiA family ribosome-associated protein [Ramlibacter rhizophilus]|uniref:HPF/RaiA family ribosome-associated protein n=1 Tax=Ramlibacter rhizophilus TaxID=1781167 RepID=A0A4Z0BF48_9BURK|nr:HPF/RaiA family ribosome-associated protein [Ramlibacter rhizophilus]TFY96937.1 HPF/RaiA family ribosome-associated protein [Ramlibacter rhizophilus]